MRQSGSARNLQLAERPILRPTEFKPLHVPAGNLDRSPCLDESPGHLLRWIAITFDCPLCLPCPAIRRGRDRPSEVGNVAAKDEIDFEAGLLCAHIRTRALRYQPKKTNFVRFAGTRENSAMPRWSHGECLESRPGAAICCARDAQGSYIHDPARRLQLFQHALTNSELL